MLIPQYRGWDPEKAVLDYYNRIKDHEIHYEPVEETTWPFIRIINVGEKIMVNVRPVYVQDAPCSTHDPIRTFMAICNREQSSSS